MKKSNKQHDASSVLSTVLEMSVLAEGIVKVQQRIEDEMRRRQGHYSNGGSEITMQIHGRNHSLINRECEQSDAESTAAIKMRSDNSSQIVDWDF